MYGRSVFHKGAASRIFRSDTNNPPLSPKDNGLGPVYVSPKKPKIGELRHSTPKPSLSPSPSSSPSDWAMDDNAVTVVRLIRPRTIKPGLNIFGKSLADPNSEGKESIRPGTKPR